MPNTKLTSARLKNHFQYSKMLYLVILVVAAMIGNLVFTMTVYHAPNERRIDIGKNDDLGAREASIDATRVDRSDESQAGAPTGKLLSSLVKEANAQGSHRPHARIVGGASAPDPPRCAAHHGRARCG